LKTIVFEIVILTFFLSSFNGFSSIKSDTLKLLLQQDTGINKTNEAQAYYIKGMSLYKKADYLSAETAFLKAIDLANKTDEKETLAYSFHLLGNIESWKSNFSQSIHYHKNAQDLFFELNNLKYVAISNNNISTVFYALGEYDSTIVYFKKNIENKAAGNFDNTILTAYKGLPIFKKKNKNQETGNLDNTILASYQGLATLYAQLYNYKKAYSYLQQGIKYAEETGSSFLLAELYYTAGNLFLNNHVNKDIALEYLQKAKKLFAEKNNWQYVNLANLSIGNVFYKTGNDSLATIYFKSVTAKVSSKNFSALSQANHMIGMVYKSNNQYDSALVYLQKSIDVMCTVCPEIAIHNTLIQAGKTYLITGNSPQAFKYLNRARNIAVESNSGFEMVKSYEELANYYQAMHNTDSVIHYLMMAHKMANDLGLLKRIKSTAESLSKIYYSKREFQTSSDYLKLSNQMNDSLASIERYNEIAKLEMRFEIEKREEERKLEAKLMQSEIAKQKLIRNSFVAGAILFIIITIVILRAYRRKKKDNKLLAKQKTDIQEISKQLQESGKRKLDFFTNISHEIRTPLTLIKSPLERILNTNKNNKEIDNQLQMALNNTNKLKGLVNQILDLQKLDESLLGLDLSDFEIIAFCQEIVALFEGYCYQSMCKLIFESNVSEAIVSFDQIRLQAIINNLLSNAFKFNNEDGFVKFNIEVNASLIKLEIKDSGIGISNEHLKKLGERYYQVEQSNASVEGTGIGLAYVKELVELMKGKLEISSIENEGTSVTISLPCDAIKIQTEKPVSMETKPRKQVFNELEEQLSDDIEDGLPRILIIEDNFELRLFLRDLFSKSYHVFCAKDGQEGKDMALKYIPDLIISDVMMPGIKGNELCKILKNDINTSHITIILFTAKDSPDSIVDGYDCGADDYIVKPFDTDLLVKKVKNIIATGENARKQFSFSDIERTSTVYSEFDKKFLKDCMSVIKDNLDNSNFTVEFLAENMSVHRRTLLRKFNSLTDKSPVDLIKHTRMSRAADLIKNKKYRVNEVALMVGYEDTNRFSQAFKQHHGMSPSAYN
jgi:signal transduction histidine kinase/DNA-binding response OmpR family regulator